MFATAETSRYRLKVTSELESLREAQKLRYCVFNLELGEGLASSEKNGLDVDPFDDQCDHLIIEDRETGKIIGTYRLQTGAMAKTGKGYYSAQEFDFSPYECIRSQVLELGRACVHADHRNRAVLDLLWRGIARYALNRGSRYLLGCSSLTSQRPEDGWSSYQQISRQCLAPVNLRTQPIGQYIMPRPRATLKFVKIPKLFAAYLGVGAWVAGPPALDRNFKTIDFLTILDVENMTPAGRKRFFKIH